MNLISFVFYQTVYHHVHAGLQSLLTPRPPAPPYAEIRKVSHSLLDYIDDAFLQGENNSECILNICGTMQMIRKLDLIWKCE